MSGELHIYRADDQPATRFKIDVSDAIRPHWVQQRKRKQLPAFCCGKLRYAANLIVHVYYDGIYYFCKKGRGCKA